VEFWGCGTMTESVASLAADGVGYGASGNFMSSPRGLRAESIANMPSSFCSISATRLTLRIWVRKWEENRRGLTYALDVLILFGLGLVSRKMHCFPSLTHLQEILVKKYEDCIERNKPVAAAHIIFAWTASALRSTASLTRPPQGWSRPFLHWWLSPRIRTGKILIHNTIRLPKQWYRI
jgi:hypothetical protein